MVRREVQLHRRGPFVEVPRLRVRSDHGSARAVLRALVERECRGVFQLEGSEQGRRWFTAKLRELIGLGLIEVVGLSPGRYRVTRLGREALALDRDRGLRR